MWVHGQMRERVFIGTIQSLPHRDLSISISFRWLCTAAPVTELNLSEPLQVPAIGICKIRQKNHGDRERCGWKQAGHAEVCAENGRRRGKAKGIGGGSCLRKAE